MKILAVLTGIGISLLVICCGWHIFPYQESDAEYINEDRLIESLDEIAGTWRIDDWFVLTYTPEEPWAYLSVDGAEPMPVGLEELTGQRLFLDGEFQYYVPNTLEGEKVMICRRDDDLIAGFTDLATNNQRIYKLTRD